MTTYFLHLREDGERIEDASGTDFPSLAAARVEAEQAARDIMAENLREGRQLDHQEIEIAGADGVVVEIVRFRDVLKAATLADDRLDEAD